LYKVLLECAYIGFDWGGFMKAYLKIALSIFISFLSITIICSVGFAATKIPPKQIISPNTGTESLEEVELQRKALFELMFSNPSDLDVAFEYAALSIRVGDVEAAISTLERMLIFAPGLPRLQLELGLLYYRVSAFQTARSYFKAAISSADVPEEVRRKVEQYLAGIATANAPNAFSGQVRAGLRYQTNANRATKNANITLNGNVFTLNPGSTGEADFNVYAAGLLHWRHELETQGDAFEADLLIYGSKQFTRNEIDLLQAELTIGPSFDLGRFKIDNAALGVYGIVSGVYLGEAYYSTGFGIGKRLVIRPTAADLFSVKTEFRRRLYYNSTGAPNATDRDGHEARAQVYYRHIISPNLAVQATGQVQRTWATVGHLAYTEATASFGPSFSFKSPFGEDKPEWIGTLSFGGTLRNYDDPDTTINASLSQRDREGYISAGLTIPIKEGWAALLETEYRIVRSNYDIREHNNFTASFSITKNW